MINFQSVLLTIYLFAGAAGVADAGPDEQETIDPRELPPRVFLRYAQRPFAQDAWGYFSGIVQHRGEDGAKKIPVDLSVLFKRDLMRAQVVLDETQVYDITLVYLDRERPQITIAEPQPRAGKASLADLGIYPRDITFSFLYWDFVEERNETEKVRGQECRIMTLADPGSDKIAIVWFSAKYLFPLKVKSFPKSEPQQIRQLEFTDFKKNKD